MLKSVRRLRGRPRRHLGPGLARQAGHAGAALSPGRLDRPDRPHPEFENGRETGRCYRGGAGAQAFAASQQREFTRWQQLISSRNIKAD